MTYVPHAPPVCQVVVIDPAITTDVLSRSYNHAFRRIDINEGCLIGVCMRYPQCYGNSVNRSLEGDWNGAHNMDEEG